MGRKKIELKKIIVFITIFISFSTCLHAVQVRNAAKIQGVRENQLLGYGIVVGLQGTGDSDFSALNSGSLTMQSIINMLEKYGIVVAPSQIKPKNVAAVIVTAQLPPFVKPGDKISVSVSSIGDARTLQGGTLLQTPLLGADKNVYAIAQGDVSVGGAISQPGFVYQKTPQNTGKIPGGAIVEKEVASSVVERGTYINIVLDRPNYTSAARLTDVINKQFWGNIASAEDAALIKVEIPGDYQKNIVEFIAALEGLYFEEEEVSNKVIINERTGTIVMGFDVIIDTVAVAHGNLNVYISPVQTIALGGMPGETVKTPKGEEGKANLHVLPGGGANISDVVSALNSIGATPKDLIAILQAMKESGALKADLEIL